MRSCYLIGGLTIDSDNIAFEVLEKYLAAQKEEEVVLFFRALNKFSNQKIPKMEFYSSKIYKSLC